MVLEESDDLSAGGSQPAGAQLIMVFAAPTVRGERLEVVNADEAYVWESTLEILYALRARVVRYDDLQWGRVTLLEQRFQTPRQGGDAAA
jgi:hypothetical protein